MFIVGFFSMDYFVKRLFVKYGKDPELVSSLTTYIVIGMLIGARLAHCLFYEPEYYLPRPLEILKVWEGGLASHGGYLGVLISVSMFLKKHKDLTFLWLMDRIVGPCLFVGGLIRLGNFFNSEILGDPTSGPFGIVFTRVDQIARHPVQLYESVGYFTIAFILMAIERKQPRNRLFGINLATAIILSFMFRFFIEFLKDEQSQIVLTDAINMGQILSLAFVAGGIVLLVRILKRDSQNQKTPLRPFSQV
jgi:phosphatidylglycerol:prolipoprotein diacylglycerol transferase